MDRREFVKTTAAASMALALPKAPAAAAVPMAGPEIEKRTREMLARMSLKEKVALMSGRSNLWKMFTSLVTKEEKTKNTPGNERLGLPGIRFTDGPRGINLNRSTCFPVSMARGASWDPALEERVASAMGYEARAQGANFSGGVCINALRHPAWGRAQETFGEDPYHLSTMGAAMVRGLQNHVMACVKHFACNSIEESRFFVNVKIGERPLREVYLPHFKACVDAGAASVMSAYNDLNGELCGHNDGLLRGILKGEWGFSGFVVSDFFFGVEDTVEAAMAGLDVEMPLTRYYGRRLEKAVRHGRVPITVIDQAATRIIRQGLRFIHLEDAPGYHESRVAGPEHTALALESARKSMVLLKNQKAALPLDRKETKRIAVLGELADAPNTGDVVSSIVRPPYVVTPLQGIKELAGGEVRYGGSSLTQARKLSAWAEAVIIVAGYTWKDEGEYAGTGGGDRESLHLHGEDVELIRAASGECDRCVVAVEGGSAVLMDRWLDGVQAVIMAWYPGMEGGTALAEIIFGDTNPSARLPINFPRSEDQLPYFSNKDREIEYDMYHGYRLADKKGHRPLFPFGFGKSYTSFEYSNLRLDKNKTGKDGSVTVSVDVKNTGGRRGEETVQLYAGVRGSGVDRPVKELKGFKKISIEPGCAATASFELNARDLAYYRSSSGEWVIEEAECMVFAGPSAAERDLLSCSFSIRG